MDRIRFALKMLLFFIVTVALAPSYVLILLILYRWRQRLGPKLVQFYSKICLSIFAVRIEGVSCPFNVVQGRGGVLIVSNHSSFLDIFVLSSLFGAVFVSKAEVKYYPVIGQIAWLTGVIFFDRSSARERMRVLNKVAQGCAGRIVAVFPQGTTGRITRRLPFNRGIFKAVEINPAMTLLPVTLLYSDDGEIAWQHPQSLGENAMAVAAKKRIDLKVFVHDPVTILDYRRMNTAQVCEKVELTVFKPLEGGHGEV